MSELYDETTDKMSIKEKEILLVKMDERYSTEQVTQIINEIGQNINGEDEEFQTPVLFLDKSVELEKVSIERLEHILEQAKAIAKTGEPDQEEVKFENEELEGVELEEEDKRIEMEDIPEELEDLVPQEVKDEQNQKIE